MNVCIAINVSRCQWAYGIASGIVYCWSDYGIELRLLTFKNIVFLA